MYQQKEMCKHRHIYDKQKKNKKIPIFGLKLDRLYELFYFSYATSRLRIPFNATTCRVFNKFLPLKLIHICKRKIYEILNVF